VIWAREKFGLAVNQQPDDAQMDQAMKELLRESAKPLAANPPVRTLIIELKAQLEQVIDEVSQDRLLSAGISEEAKEKARAMTESFEAYIREHKDEIDALQFFYSQPYARRLRYQDIKALADTIKMPPRSWTPDILWHAYETLEKDKVRGAASGRLLTDMVSLVRFALHQQNELVPYADQVRERFLNWLAQQNHRFSASQIHWLEMMRDHIAASLEMEMDDFDYAPFAEEGGLGRATQVFGQDLPTLLQELNRVLAA
jgi:type I restriction enzyme R subunit